MTIHDVIQYVDEVKPNAFSTAVKVKWLEQLDGHIAAEELCMSPVDLQKLRYSEDNLDAELLVEAPYDDIYPLWLEAKIDLANGEYNKYQNSMQLYNQHYGSFVVWFAEHFEREWKLWKGRRPGKHWEGFYFLSDYGLAVKHGFAGTEEEWLKNLKGEQGDALRLRYNAERQMLEQWYEGSENKEDLMSLEQLQGSLVSATIAMIRAAQAAAEAAQAEAEKAAASAGGDATAAADSEGNASAAAAAADQAKATAQAAAAQAKADADRAAQIAAEMNKIAAQINQDATAASQAKADAQTAQGKAEAAQKAAEIARQAAEDAAKSTGANVTAAQAAATRAESAAGAAAATLQELQSLYEAMQTYAEQAIRVIRSEGNAQLEQIAAEGTAQLTAMTLQADRAESAAGAAAGSATEAERAKQEAEDAKAAAGKSATESADSAKVSKEAANRAELAAVRQPYPDTETGTWWAWDATTGAYVDTGETYNGNVMYATFGVDPATGQLVMTTPDGYAGPMFAINENGELEVSISA